MSAGKAQRVWSDDFDVTSEPIIVNGIGYYDFTGDVVAIDQTSGRVLWTVNQFSTKFVVTGGVVILAAWSSTPYGSSPYGLSLIGLDAATGQQLWRNQSAAMSTLETADDGVAFVLGDATFDADDEADPQGIYALDASDGAILWHLQPGPMLGDLVASDGEVIASFTSYAAGPQPVDTTSAFGDWDGTQQWTTTAFATGWGSTVNAVDGLLLVSPGSSLYGFPPSLTSTAIDPATGAVQWSVTTTLSFIGAGSGVVVFSGNGEGMAAFDEATGQIRWESPLTGLAVASGLVYTSPNSPVLSALDAATGTFVANLPVQGGGVLSPLVSEVTNGVIASYSSYGIDGYRLPTANFTPPSVGLATTPDSRGYWIAGQDGGVFTFGDAPFRGSLPGLGLAVDDIVGIAATPDGNGYWLVGADGGVFTFGDARYSGSLPQLGIHVDDIVGIAPTPDGNGYWLVGWDGAVYAFGRAPFYGPTGPNPFSVVALIPSRDGRGYTLFGQGGETSSFGDAGGLPTTSWVSGFSTYCEYCYLGAVAAATTSSGQGAWVVTPDGGVFTYGDAVFENSVPGLPGTEGTLDIIAIEVTNNFKGYWLLGSDGGVFAFGDAPYLGSRGQ